MITIERHPIRSFYPQLIKLTMGYQTGRHQSWLMGQYLKTIFHRNKKVSIAFDNGKPIGWCYTHRMTVDDRTLDAHTTTIGVYVLPKYRGRRVGAMLVSAEVDHKKPREIAAWVEVGRWAFYNPILESRGATLKVRGKDWAIWNLKA